MKPWIRKAKFLYHAKYWGYAIVMYFFLSQVTNTIIAHYPDWPRRIWIMFCLLGWYMMSLCESDFQDNLREEKRRIKKMEEEYNNV